MEGIDFVSKRARDFTPSPIMALSTRVKQLQKAGEDIISFGIGEPDFDTPQNVKDAAIKAMKDGFTKYTQEAGTPELRSAIAKKFREENGIRYSPEQVVVSNGAKHSLYNAFLATLNEGDEVIICAPYWVSYEEQVKLAGGKPVIVRCKDDFGLDVDAIAQKINSKTRLVLVNSPNNPSGAVYPEKDLRRLLDAVLASDALILSDEVYESIVFEPNRHKSIASFSEEARERTITVNSASKTYAMTGWRMGYAAGPEKVMNAISAIQGQTTSGPNSIAQKAVLEALSGPQDSVRMMVAAYQKRRDMVMNLLGKLDGVATVRPGGTFYAFPKVSGLYNTRVKSSVEFSKFVLDEAKVALVPGSAFGYDDCVRISFATSEEKISEGFERMRTALPRI